MFAAICGDNEHFARKQENPCEITVSLFSRHSSERSEALRRQEAWFFGEVHEHRVLVRDHNSRRYRSHVARKFLSWNTIGGSGKKKCPSGHRERMDRSRPGVGRAIRLRAACEQGNSRWSRYNSVRVRDVLHVCDAPTCPTVRPVYPRSTMASYPVHRHRAEKAKQRKRKREGERERKKDNKRGRENG